MTRVVGLCLSLLLVSCGQVERSLDIDGERAERTSERLRRMALTYEFGGAEVEASAEAFIDGGFVFQDCLPDENPGWNELQSDGELACGVIALAILSSKSGFANACVATTSAMFT